MPTNRFICSFTAFLSLVALLLAVDPIQAQNTNIPINSFAEKILQRYEIMDSSGGLLTTQRPYGRKEGAAFTERYGQQSFFFDQTDSYNFQYLQNDQSEFFPGLQSGSNEPLFGIFFREAAHFFHAEGEHFFVHLDPVIYNSFGSSSDSAGLLFENTRGLEVRAGIDERVGFYVYATDNQARYPGYVTDAANGNIQKVVPSLGWSKPFKAQGFDFPVTRGHMNVQLFEHMDLEIGQDRIFIGDGVRSLIWSDNAKEPFYVRLNAHFWKLRYQSNFMELINMNQPKLPDNRWRRKYAVLHDLNIQLSKNISAGIFESVIFERNDSLGYPTGFELQYANPIIFYRAVEYGLGSPDNVTLGVHWKWNFLQRFSYYGQFVLDELQFFRLTGNEGWWGNKFGLQNGIKYINAFGVSHLDLQAEWNRVRPYMYSYDNNNGSSYTHYAQAIAHPLGANFNELIFGMDYQPAPKWWMSGKAIMASTGMDSTGSNWGQNIFLNYDTRSQDFGNDVGQGVAATLFYAELLVSWQFWHNTFLDGRVVHRSFDVAGTNDQELFFSIGVRMNNVIPQFRF